jgi:hypothetical protein
MQNIAWYLVFYNTLTPVAGAEPTANGPLVFTGRPLATPYQ